MPKEKRTKLAEIKNRMEQKWPDKFTDAEWKTISKYNEAKENLQREELKTLSESKLKRLLSLAIAIELQLALWGLSPYSEKSQYQDCCTNLMRIYKNFRDMDASKKTYSSFDQQLQNNATLLVQKYGLEVNGSIEKKEVTERLQKIFDDGKHETALGRFKSDYGDKIEDDKVKEAIRKTIQKISPGFWKTVLDTTKKVLKYAAYTTAALIVVAEALDL